jgi:hypothetical protein
MKSVNYKALHYTILLILRELNRIMDYFRPIWVSFVLYLKYQPKAKVDILD